MIDIEELKRLMDEASALPWANHKVLGGYAVTEKNTEDHEYFLIASFPKVNARCDSAYTVAACNQVPELIAEIERLRSAAESLQTPVVPATAGGSDADTQTNKRKT